jgi:metal-sulfur cluster biosynthetic enzyme
MPDVPVEWKGQLLRALSGIMDPDFNKDIVSLGFVQNLALDPDTRQVAFDVQLTTGRYCNGCARTQYINNHTHIASSSTSGMSHQRIVSRSVHAGCELTAMDQSTGYRHHDGTARYGRFTHRTFGTRTSQGDHRCIQL